MAQVFKLICFAILVLVLLQLTDAIGNKYSVQGKKRSLENMKSNMKNVLDNSKKIKKKSVDFLMAMKNNLSEKYKNSRIGKKSKSRKSTQDSNKTFKRSNHIGFS